MCEHPGMGVSISTTKEKKTKPTTKSIEVRLKGKINLIKKKKSQGKLYKHSATRS